MREWFNKQMEILHTELIHMGALCEQAIHEAVRGLLEGDRAVTKRVLQIEQNINTKEREIEEHSIRLLLREQPVAGDLRRITAALKMIVDMERIGDQAADIAEIAEYIRESTIKNDIPIDSMADSAARMLTESINSFVSSDIATAESVIALDNEVDALFVAIKQGLAGHMVRDEKAGEECLDLLMAAKYLERIGDHAENIAQWVVYAVTGQRTGESDDLPG